MHDSIILTTQVSYKYVVKDTIEKSRTFFFYNASELVAVISVKTIDPAGVCSLVVKGFIIALDFQLGRLLYICLHAYSPFSLSVCLLMECLALSISE